MRPFLAVAKSYPNSLAAVPYTADQLARLVAGYSLHFSPIKDQTVEWQVAWPSFVYTFHRHLHPLPTQPQFWEAYVADNEPFFRQRPLSPPEQQALQARVYRTYPSLVRDLHFALFLREHLAHVLYNPQLDVEEGVDLMVAVHGRLFALNLYTDTKRAHDGRQRKQSRHTPFTDVTYLELPVSLHGAIRAGSFLLYGPREWRQLQHLLPLA
jgi:hypothetical protein